MLFDLRNHIKSFFSADAANNFNAEGLANPERILNYLLRQQSENAYLKSKNRWILRFWRVFLDFLIFSIFDDFSMVSLSISISWLDFLPGGGLRSPGHWIFAQNGNFVKDVTGRNKNYQKYQLWAYNEFIIQTSSRALALHALIISLKPSRKIVKLENLNHLA